jgi:hypothetical protein
VATKQDAATTVATCLAGGGGAKHANGRAIEQLVLYCICSESKELLLVEMKLDAQDAPCNRAKMRLEQINQHSTARCRRVAAACTR